MGSLLSKTERVGVVVVQTGRWKTKTPRQVDINSYWNNIDHCGDYICGNPIRSKQLLDTITTKKKYKID